MSVIVFGSINMDLIVHCPKLPLPGETLLGGTFLVAAGGKGANQAVASSRLGAETFMVGCLGRDDFGISLLEALSEDNVLTTNVRTDRTEATGVALITVEQSGENTIVVTSGANMSLSLDDVESMKPLLDKAKVLLLQLEVPLISTLAAAQLARNHGITVVLDPAPAQDLPAELYECLDVITPNEGEAARLVGFPLQDDEAIAKAAQILLQRGARNVIIKLGGKGAHWLNPTDATFKQPFTVEAIDTTAAGDAFNGGLAAALSEGQDLDTAIDWALAAGALTVTKQGAQPSLPSRQDLLDLLKWGTYASNQPF